MINHPNRSKKVDHPILSIFNAADLLDGFDPIKHRLVVYRDGKVIGQITPAHDLYMEMMYLQNGTTIGPAWQLSQMRKRILFEAFRGDAVAMSQAEVRREIKPKF